MTLTRRLRVLTLAVAICIWLLVPAPFGVAVPQDAPYRLVWDDFRSGFTVSGDQAKWFHPGAGEWVPEDGIATTTGRGLRVVASGVNQETGDPAFSLTSEQDPDTGGLDHAKWVAFTTHTASSGYPGFDALPGQELSCETWLSGRTYGTDRHPFGTLVDDPRDDLRLASVAMNAADVETGMIFDFFLTNRGLYAFYERGVYNRAELGNYAAFAFAVPVADRQPGERHHLRIGYDRAAGIVRWYVDGREVYRVGRLGRHIDRKYMVLDHGGVEKPAEPRQLNCGMGMFSVLDGAKPGVRKSGLVRLVDADGFYLDPASTARRSQVFLDDHSRAENRLFGQGASLTSTRYVVSSLEIGPDR